VKPLGAIIEKVTDCNISLPVHVVKKSDSTVIDVTNCYRKAKKHNLVTNKMESGDIIV
jgi:hypothetical protein